MNTIKKPDIPCKKGCQNRNQDCHINCIAYISYRRQLDKWNKKDRAKRQGYNAGYESAWKKTSTIERLRKGAKQ